MARTLDLSLSARRIEQGKYWLWDMECPTEVMAAFERSLARRGHMLQRDGDLLVGWVIEQSLVRGDFGMVSQMRVALEELGWHPSTDTP
jgi:hypothetical protein